MIDRPDDGPDDDPGNDPNDIFASLIGSEFIGLEDFLSTDFSHQLGGLKLLLLTPWVK